MKYCQLLLFLLISVVMTACHHSPGMKSIRNNYMLSWRNDTNYILVQNFEADTSRKNTTPYIEATGSNSGKFTVRNLTDGPALYMAYGQPIPPAEGYYSTKKSPSAFWDKPFKPDSTTRFLVNYLSDDTTMSVKLSCVKAQHVNYYNQDKAELIIEDSQINYLAVHGSGWRTPIYPLKLIINNYNDKGFRELQVSYKDIVALNLNQEIGKVTIKNATVTESTASIFGYIAPDTLVLDSVRFLYASSTLNLKGLGGVKYNTEKPIVLICKNTDVSHLRLDYRQYKYYSLGYTNEYYSNDKLQFARLLQLQETDHNEAGIRKVKLDSARFEDRAAGISEAWIWFKTWWNNYGFDKYKIFNTALWLFCGVVLLNVFFFKSIISAYSLAHIETAYQSHANISNRYLRFARRVPVYILYSGYIFFGLKLDLKELKLDKMWVACLIILEYSLGIVVIGYVANLIISK